MYGISKYTFRFQELSWLGDPIPGRREHALAPISTYSINCKPKRGGREEGRGKHSYSTLARGKAAFERRGEFSEREQKIVCRFGGAVRQLLNATLHVETTTFGFAHACKLHAKRFWLLHVHWYIRNVDCELVLGCKTKTVQKTLKPRQLLSTDDF